MSATDKTTSATYAGLFGETWSQRCAPEALESSLGLFAYADDLYRHARRLERDLDDEPASPLARRRPDIGDLWLDEAALKQDVSQLSIALRCMQSLVEKCSADGRSAAAVLATATSPAALPFDLAWERIVEVLRRKRVQPWQLLRQVDHTYPNFIGDAAGRADMRDALALCTTMSPAQLRSLARPPVTEDDSEFWESLGLPADTTIDALADTARFSELTGLSNKGIRQLLAVSGVSPESGDEVYTSVHASPNALPGGTADSTVHGASFINDGGPAALRLFQGDDRRVRIDGLTLPHLDRIWRVLQLKAGLGLPFADVDRLLQATRHAQGRTSGFAIDGHVLSALGLYRHFADTRDMTVDTFAALIDGISPYGTGRQKPYYDELFPSNAGDTLPSLVMDGATLGEVGRGQLGAGLGIDDGICRTLLQWAGDAIGMPEPLARLDLVSAVHRLATLPATIGLTMTQGMALYRLLQATQPDLFARLAGRATLDREDAVDHLPDTLDAIVTLMNMAEWLERQRIDADTLRELLTSPTSLVKQIQGGSALATTKSTEKDRYLGLDLSDTSPAAMLSRAYRLCEWNEVRERGLVNGKSLDATDKFLWQTYLIRSHGGTPELLQQELGEHLGISQEVISSAIAHLPSPKRPGVLYDIHDIAWMIRLHGLSQQYGLSVDALLALAELQTGSGLAAVEAAGQRCLAELEQDDRRKVQDRLDESWREALCDWLLWHATDDEDRPFDDADDLSGWLLCDVEVGAAPLTTPLSATIESLQIYIQRLLSGVERTLDARVNVGAESNSWQNHMSTYEAWRRRREATLYPENHLNPLRRQYKTKAFADLEAELAQGRARPTDIESSLLNYLTDFEATCNLQVLTGYEDGTDPDNDTFHFIGRSNTEPAEFYWRSVDMSKKGADGHPSVLAWSDWERVNLPLSGQLARMKLPLDEGDTRDSIEAIRPFTIDGRRYVAWIERDTSPITFDGETSPSEFYALSVCYAFRHSDHTWSSANLLIRLDGRRPDGRRPKPAAATSTEKLAALKLFKADLLPGLIVMEDKKGQRGADPYLVAMVYDSLRAATKQPASYWKRDETYYFAVRDLLLIDDKQLDSDQSLREGRRPLETKLVRQWHDLYANPRVVQHPYIGTTYILELGKETSTGEDEYYLFNHAAKLTAELAPDNRAICLRAEFSSNWTLRPGRNDLSRLREITFYDAEKQGIVSIAIARKASAIQVRTYTHPRDSDPIGVDKIIQLVESVRTFPAVFFSEKTQKLHIRAPLDADFIHLIGGYKEEVYLSSDSIVAAIDLRTGDTVGNVHFRSSHVEISTAKLVWDEDGVEPTYITATPTRVLGSDRKAIPYTDHGTDDLSILEFAVPIDDDVDEYEFELQLEAHEDDGRKKSRRTVQTLRSLFRLRDLTEETSELADDKVPTVTLRRNALQAQYMEMTDTGAPPIRLNSLFGKQLVARATRSVADVLSLETQRLSEPPLKDEAVGLTVDFSGANGLAFWELFFHVPWLVAWQLRETRQYADATQWCIRHLLDPYARRQVLPEHDPSFWRSIPILSRLACASEGDGDPEVLGYVDDIHFRKAVHMFLVNTWRMQGDEAYRRLTRDSVREAAFCYQKAMQLIGPIEEPFDALAWTPVALRSGQVRKTRPQNEVLIGIRALLMERLGNLRQGLSIVGASLPARVYAMDDHFSGVGAGRELADGASATTVSFSIPQYRFHQVMPLARSAIDRLTAMGRYLFEIYEHEADGALDLCAREHLVELARLDIALKRQALDAARRQESTLALGRKGIELRKRYYDALVLEGQTDTENAASILAWGAVTAMGASSVPLTASGIARSFPNVFGLANGGHDYGAALEAASDLMMRGAEASRFSAEELRVLAAHQRRMDEWRYEIVIAQNDLDVADAEIAERKLQTDMATAELRRAQVAHEMLVNEWRMADSGFAISSTYTWMLARLGELMASTYSSVFSLCTIAEACYRFETGKLTSTFIPADAWTDAWRGLLAGEALSNGLDALEAAYLVDHERRPVIRKTLSLKSLLGEGEFARQLSQRKFVFTLSAGLFDKDFPGQFLRRIRNVSLELVATAKAMSLREDSEVGVVLTQTGNTLLCAADQAGAAALYQAPKVWPASVTRDVRNQQQMIFSRAAAAATLDPVETIVLRSDYTDGRYLPFEGTGALSSWTLTFAGQPQRHEALLAELDDVVIRLDYTAAWGGGEFKAEVDKLVAKLPKGA